MYRIRDSIIGFLGGLLEEYPRYIVMIEHNPLLDGRIEGSDRYGAWRINADIMSYEVRVYSLVLTVFRINYKSNR
ncbi:hypothetical protein HanHA300_Chr08g0267641 [Helianthus annuus]|nr:hypothetical protein HanHA300_Chr08g0267641 [Helianthus annuus]KAJ0718064.1 hypothetical protein HanLR1_Chr08g0266521 [Helianthus annuus]KAJ0721302.1 hypothetical protein HanOQP8_Chr08g0274061 [Helianthus annuus]